MAVRWQGLFVTVASACVLGACAHTSAGVDVASTHPGEAGFGALGDDLPTGNVASASATPKGVKRAARTAKVASIDVPVASLCARSAARAVVERDLPGLTTRPEYAFFKHMSLRQLQAASGGRMSEAELQQVSADLSALPPDGATHGKRRRRTLLVRIASILP